MADKTDKIDEAYVMELIAGDVPLAKKKDLSPPGKPLEQKGGTDSRDKSETETIECR